MAANLAQESFWVDKSYYHEAEKRYYENLAQLMIGVNQLKTGNSDAKTSIRVVSAIPTIWTIMAPTLSHDISLDKFWTDRVYYHYAEKVYYEKLAKLNSGQLPLVNGESKKSRKKGKHAKSAGSHSGDGACRNVEPKAPAAPGRGASASRAAVQSTLASEVAKAREHIKTSLQNVGSLPPAAGESALLKTVTAVQDMLQSLERRVAALEIKCSGCPPAPATPKQQHVPALPKPQSVPAKSAAKDNDDDDVDLFGSGSEEEDVDAAKLKEQRLAEYAAKKSKKPALIAKSSIILDVKPWDDETDMGAMEKSVRSVEMDGLLWGASKLVPVGYGIKKLQITCVVEDDKVSVDLLTETIEGFEDLVQSVDIAAFNKI